MCTTKANASCLILLRFTVCVKKSKFTGRTSFADMVYHVRSQFCICPIRSAVIVCAKWWHEWIIKNQIARQFLQDVDDQIIKLYERYTWCKHHSCVRAVIQHMFFMWTLPFKCNGKRRICPRETYANTASCSNNAWWLKTICTGVTAAFGFQENKNNKSCNLLW